MNVQDSRTGPIKRQYPEQLLETWFAETLSGFFGPCRALHRSGSKEQNLMVAAQGVMTYGAG